MIEIKCGDCIDIMSEIDSQFIDVVITSPPYNIGINYASYQDDISDLEYIKWSEQWIRLVSNILKQDGSFFLNISGSRKKPWLPYDIVSLCKKYFILQNEIIWVKSIHIKSIPHTYGHVKPINTNRYLNGTHEFIFHFTKNGDVEINRYDEGIGVPFSDKTNLTRWKHDRINGCGGNTWFIPYKTINSKDQRKNHPAVFPEELPEKCIKLHGFNQDTLILDPFGGIGTTAKVCKKLDIHCISIDIDEGYCEDAKREIKLL